MSTSAKPHFLSEILEGKPIPKGKLAFFQERFRDHLYELVVSEFLKREQAGVLTKAAVCTSPWERSIPNHAVAWRARKLGTRYCQRFVAGDCAGGTRNFADTPHVASGLSRDAAHRRCRHQDYS